MSLTADTELALSSSPGGDRRYATVDPSTGEQIRDYSFMTRAELDAAIEAAHQAFLTWRRRPVLERARVLARG